MTKKKPALLGDCFPEKKHFSDVSALLKEFDRKEFLALNERMRSETINRALFAWIEKQPEPCFLLPAVLDFVEQVDRKKVLDHYHFSHFELWLNQLSGLKFEENCRIRAKIAGKWVDRSEYQILFPIGMGKVYEGTHFVTAHKSPDLDTTVASFWGWLDAFAARVSEGMHIWNLPGGPPASQIEIDWMFRDLFGSAVFTHLAKTRTALNLTGIDLMTQKGMMRAVLTDSITAIDHGRDQVAVVVVDEEGRYLGDWRHFDVEGVRQVIILLSSCLRWFENSLNLHLLSLFAKKKLHADEIEPVLERLFQKPLKECEPAHEFSSAQRQQVSDFASSVLGLKGGLASTFGQLVERLSKLSRVPCDDPATIFRQMKSGKLFDEKGGLVEDRSRIFHFLEKAVRDLHEGIVKIRARLEQIDIALKTKREVFQRKPTFVSARSDVEDIRHKMGSYPYLTVVSQETTPTEGEEIPLSPIGVVLAADLRKSILGTVSLRDFCNRDEMTIPAYLDVISVIDHHKSTLNTFSPPLAIIADVQSSNTLTADKAFEINDNYSLAGQAPQAIDEQIQAQARLSSPESDRLLQRLLKKRQIAQKKSPYYVHPDRESTEYLHFLYAILDDTDLLSKVTAFDVECVASLLNRLKSLSLGRETEIVSLDDIPRDKQFPKKAAERILRNEDMYSLYSKVYAYREREVEKNLALCAEGKASNLFADTKEQNGCCRIGQTKLFATSIPFFEKHADAIRRVWLQAAQKTQKEKPEIDLHIHMISTVVHADEIYRGTSGKYAHKDELWIWIPSKEVAIEHLSHFLNAFQASPGLKDNPLQVEFLGSNAEDLALIFKENFFDIAQKRSQKDLPVAVVRFKAGSLNSRKAMVSPFLPTV